MKIVVAVDGSEQARHALHTALDFASASPDPHVYVVSVVDYFTLPAGLTDSPAGAPDVLASDAETELHVAEEIARQKHQVVQTQVLRGHVVSEVLRYAREIGADLIVVGTHGRRGFERALLGSTCEALVRQSEIPVLTVRGVAPVAAAD